MSQFPPPVNPDDLGRGPLIVGLTWTFASLAVIAVVLRFYVRIKLTSGPALDDWLMGVALVSASTKYTHLKTGRAGLFVMRAMLTISN